MTGEIVVVGGTSGMGRRLAETCSSRGQHVVLTGRSEERADAVAREIGGSARGIAVDLSEPESIADCLRDVGQVRHLVVAAIDRDENTVREYDIRRAARLVTLKLIGYTEVVHALASRLLPDASIVLFGGLAKDRPYPGSTTVTTVNGGVTGLVRHPGGRACPGAGERPPPRHRRRHAGLERQAGRGARAYRRTHADRPSRCDGRRGARGAASCSRTRRSNGVNLAVDGGWLLQ